MDLLQQLDPPEHLDMPVVSDSSDTDDFLQELAALNDAGLLRATMESLECGRLTPLIKEELRCRIQSRRLSEGKEELFVEFPSPTPSQPRPDEVEKRDRRREQNRRAAQKFRKKKKERGEHLMEETQRLECQNTSLRSEIKQLHEEREQLTRIIQSHASICPLTPRQSPLTIPRESPVPSIIRESPLALPSFSGNFLTQSPVMGKSPVLVQSPAILVPPTRESPVPLLIINPARESPVPKAIIPSSPIPAFSRPRKSPVSLIRINQSPIPGEKIGDKSPIPFGSPPKQSKHSIPPRLNLAGPKPVIPILPKPAPVGCPEGTPSPRTPRSVITSPLPIARSPVSRGRAIHVSPVFFRDGCFTPSAHGGQVIHSPVSVSDSSSSSTPGRIVQQSPVFFGEGALTSVQASPQFVQSSSTSSMSSATSLASLLRQESPISVLSTSSGISSAGSVFTSNSIVLNVCGKTAADNTNIVSDKNILEKVPKAFSCSPTVRDNFEDNMLSLEDIEKSASGFEARDDLIDFEDIQALLDLGADHTAIVLGETSSDRPAECHSAGQNEHSVDTLGAIQSEDIVIDVEATQNVTAFRAPGLNHFRNTNTRSPTPGLGLSLSALTETINKLTASTSAHSMSYSPTFQGETPVCTHPVTCRANRAFMESSAGNFTSSFDGQKGTTTLGNICGDQKEPIFQIIGKNEYGNHPNTIIGKNLDEHEKIIRVENMRIDLEENSVIRAANIYDSSKLGDAIQLGSRTVEDGNMRFDNNFLQTVAPAGGTDSSDSELMNLHISLSSEDLVRSLSACSTNTDGICTSNTHHHLS